MSLNRHVLALIVACSTVVASAPAAAQQTESRIIGTVSDQNGGMLPGVTVTVTSKSTGAVRSVVSDEMGRYVVTNLGPGAYQVSIELTGFAPKQPGGHARRRRHQAGGRGAGSRRAERVGHRRRRRLGRRHQLRQDRRQRVARGDREPAGERPELREPDDARDRRHHRRQRRLGERAVQRQVQSAELPELRRRRRHVCLGREPRLSRRDGFAVPAADVDGVDRGVPRQLRSRAGGERPRRGRQHHGRQQERQQSPQRIALRLSAQRRDGLGQQVRRQEATARDEPVRRVARRPARVEQDVLLRQLRGIEAEHGDQLHRGGAERRGDPPDHGGRAGRHRATDRARRARRRWRPCWPASRAARSPRPTRCWRSPRWRRRRSRKSTARRSASTSGSTTASCRTCGSSTATATSTRRIARSRRAGSAPSSSRSTWCSITSRSPAVT